MIDILLLLGLAILLGFIGAKFGERIKAPHVVGFVLVGVLLGGSFLGAFEADMLDKLDVINFFALALIGFSIGGELLFSTLKKLARTIISITILESFGAFIVVTLGVFALTHKPHIALIFGALACATDPATTTLVLREYKSSGPLTSTLFAVVAIDDAVAIIIYAFASVFARASITGYEQISLATIIGHPLMEIGGSLLLGGILGVALCGVTDKMHNREELLAVSLGTILVCCGLSNMLHLSLILANMALGVAFINLPFGNKRVVDEINSISLPIYILFFILVGARLQVGLLPTLGALGVVYILFRSMGKVLGSFCGAKLSGAEDVVAKYVGFGMFPQAGVVIGLAILALHEFQAYGIAGSQLGASVINVIIATTFVFQIVGPLATKFAITKAGEVGKHA